RQLVEASDICGHGIDACVLLAVDADQCLGTHLDVGCAACAEICHRALVHLAVLSRHLVHAGIFPTIEGDLHPFDATEVDWQDANPLTFAIASRVLPRKTPSASPAMLGGQKGRT